MKCRFLLLILIFTSTITFAQSWHEFLPHNQEPVQITSGTNEGYLVGSLRYPSKLVISKDNGATWEDFYVYEDSEAITNRVHPWKFKQDDNNDFYLRVGQSILKYDRTDQEWSTILDNISLKDFDILSDGNIITQTGYMLNLYDPQGGLITSHTSNGYFTKLIIGEGDVHYTMHSAGFTYESYRFNSDLTEISAEYIHDEARIITHDFYLQNERIFSRYAYSDDGETWVPYSNDLIGDVVIMGNNTICLIGSGGMYCSEDNGETFSLGSIPTSSFSNEYFTLRNSEILLFNKRIGCGNPDEAYISSGNRTEWTQINIEAGNPYAEHLEAVAHDNIFVSQCLETHKFTTNSSTSGWQSFDPFSFDIDPVGFEFYSFENGRIITDKGFFSDDEGLTWTSTELFINEESHLIVKEGVAYIITRSYFFKSTDQGETWEQFEFVDYPESFQMHDITASEHHFYIITSEDKLVKTTLEGTIINETPLDESQVYYSLVTSYTGEEVYFLSRDDEVFLHYSFDDGESFEFRTLGIPGNGRHELSNDQFGNLYLMSESELLISQDKGESWSNITPDYPHHLILKDFDVAHDARIYLATNGSPILKSSFDVLEAMTATKDYEEGNMTIYPNPASEFIQIDYTENLTISSYEIFNAEGQKVMTGHKDFGEKISIQHLIPRVYLFKLNTEVGTSFNKLITIIK